LPKPGGGGSAGLGVGGAVWCPGVGRAVEKGETKGLMKMLVDAETRAILGAAILGTGGDEAIHGILNAMNLGATAPTLQWAVPIHPTVSELIPTLLGDLKPLP